MAETGCGKVEGGVWGCIVVVASFLIQVITSGTSQSIGIYSVEFLEYFDDGAAAVSLCGSINLGLFLGAGPLASLLITRWSCRQITLVGALLANIGLIGMPFAPNLPYIYVFYGVILGLGYCLSFVPSHILSGLYFNKQRSCATALVKSGSGFGASIFPMLYYYLIEYYGWRGSYFIVAGINFHLFVLAAVLRPVPKGLLEYFKIQENADRRQIAHKTKPRDNENGTALIGPESLEMNYMSVERNREILNENTENRIDFGISVKEMRKKDGIHDGGTLSKNEEMMSKSLDADCSSPMLTDSEQKQDGKSMKARFKDRCLAVATFDFISFCLSTLFWNAGVGVLLIFLPKYMIHNGISKHHASIAFLAIGTGSCLGCIAGGFLGNIQCINRIALYINAAFGAGLWTFLMICPVFHNFVSMYILVLMFGLMFGIMLGLLMVVTSDLLGIEAMSDGFGYLMFCNGAGLFLGPPLAGLIIDVSGRLGPGIIFASALMMIGGVVMCVVPVKRRIWGYVDVHRETDKEQYIEIPQ